MKSMAQRRPRRTDHNDNSPEFADDDLGLVRLRTFKQAREADDSDLFLGDKLE